MPQFLVKIFAILCLTRLNLVYFSANSSVIFTWLILGLHSLKSSQLSLESNLCILSPSDFLVNFLGQTRAKLTKSGNFIVWLPFIREILNNMCIVILCKPGCDIINFKINIIFLIKPLWHLCKNTVNVIKFLHRPNSEKIND